MARLYLVIKEEKKYSENCEVKFLEDELDVATHLKKGWKAFSFEVKKVENVGITLTEEN